jgi:hypothetical protein
MDQLQHPARSSEDDSPANISALREIGLLLAALHQHFVPSSPASAQPYLVLRKHPVVSGSLLGNFDDDGPNMPDDHHQKEQGKYFFAAKETRRNEHQQLGL